MTGQIKSVANKIVPAIHLPELTIAGIHNTYLVDNSVGLIRVIITALNIIRIHSYTDNESAAHGAIE